MQVVWGFLKFGYFLLKLSGNTDFILKPQATKKRDYIFLRWAGNETCLTVSHAELELQKLLITTGQFLLMNTKQKPVENFISVVHLKASRANLQRERSDDESALPKQVLLSLTSYDETALFQYRSKRQLFLVLKLSVLLLSV